MLDATIRFPCVAHSSQAAWLTWRAAQSDMLDERYRRELALASPAPLIEKAGSCATCLAITRYVSQTQGGEATADGRLMPNWREQQVCQCSLRMNSRRRALVHCASYIFGTLEKTRAAILGADPAVERALTALGANVADASAAHGRLCDLVVSGDYLQTVPMLDPVLAGTAAMVLPGGAFIFTVPFHLGEDTTVSDLGQSPPGPRGWPAHVARNIHRFGWDLLDRVAHAGFEHCEALAYWSEEFGYLGSANIVFVAMR